MSDMGTNLSIGGTRIAAMNARGSSAGEPDPISWLFDGDPAIRWQVMRDLLGALPAEYESERLKVATEGWGARLLAEQRPDGRWSTNTYTPKWTSTFYTMQLLWYLGMDPSTEAAQKGSRVVLDNGQAADGGLRCGRDRQRQPRLGEVCESGMGMAAIAWFLPDEPRLPVLRHNLLTEQFADGGWNCSRKASHSSFNTTIVVLEGLSQWERAHGPDEEVTAARRRGEEFLFAHQMFRSHTSGEVVRKGYLELSFPGRWHYDTLRALDYLAGAGAKRDHRAGEAIEILRSKRRADGLWPLQAPHAGAVYFEMEEVRKPSRWNTLRALRVLRWWDDAETH